MHVDRARFLVTVVNLFSSSAGLMCAEGDFWVQIYMLFFVIFIALPGFELRWLRGQPREVAFLLVLSDIYLFVLMEVKAARTR